MNFAWSASVVLALLLPGFVFFIGLYSREKFDRTTSSAEVSSKLAAIVSVSVASHAIVLLILVGVRRFHWLSVEPDFFTLLSTFNPDAKNAEPLGSVAASLWSNAPWICAYLFLTGAIGWGLGYLCGWRVLKGNFRSLLRGAWLYELWQQDEKSGELTHAFVFSKIPKASPGEFILYRGTLRRLGLSDDGRVSFLVLDWPSKCSVTRDPATNEAIEVTWKELGAASMKQGGGAPAFHRYFYVDVGEASNLVFERYELPKGNLKDVDKVIHDQEVKKTSSQPVR